MLDDQIIKQATEEVLAEMGLGDRRFEIEPATGAAHEETARQIRVFEANGTARATVVDFRNEDGRLSIYFDEMKEKIRRRLETQFPASRSKSSG